MLYCSNCGKPIPDESKFCSYCGTARPVAGTPNPEQAQPPPSSQPVQPVPSATQNPQVVTTVSGTTQPAAKPATGVFAFNNVGFWGAIMLLVGFFLPFYQTYYGTISLSQMATSADNNAGRILLFLLPVSAAILIIQGLTYAFPPIIHNIAKILPLLLIVFTLGAIIREDETGGSLEVFFQIAQIGVYLTLLGSLLMLFFRRKP